MDRSRLSRALLALRKYSRVLRHRRAPADCFGANPVASALGHPARRDPSEAMRTYHEGRQLALVTGTFYLATNRNFLFGSDKAALDRWGRGDPESYLETYAREITAPCVGSKTDESTRR